MKQNINEFLKEMTAITGLYGDELFDFIREKIGKPQTNNDNKQQTGDDIEKRVMNDKNWEPRKEVEHFQGDINSIKLFYKICGGKESIAKWFGSCCPELVCTKMAIVCDVREFYWIKPVVLSKGNKVLGQGWVRYGVKWDPNKKVYMDLPSVQVSENEIS